MLHFRKYFSLFVALFLLICAEASAQKFLAIDKSGKVKRLRFYVNEKINIRLQDEHFFRSGYINAIADTSFIFEGKSIPLSGVNAILVYKDKGSHALIKELSGKLPGAAVFLLFVTTVNSLINASYPLIPASMLVVTGGMAATGILLHPLTFRVYKTKNHPLKIIDVTIVAKE